MLDAIYVALTGLQGFSRSLNQVANNTANINTPGFKTASVPLVDAFYTESQQGQMGHGMKTLDAVRNFSQGEIRTTGAPLDLAIDGQGFFMLQGTQGERRYTRAGKFGVTAEGLLQHTADGAAVLDASAKPISIADRKNQTGRATSKLTFRGNLSSTADTVDLSSISLIDPEGKEHTASLSATRDTSASPLTWKLKLSEGSTVLGEASVVFVDGVPTAETAKPALSLALSGAASQTVTLDLSSDVTSFAAGTSSSFALLNRDGFTAGTLSSVGFNISGHVMLGYSNGQSEQGPQIGLARFDPRITLKPEGDNQFSVEKGVEPEIGAAGQGGFGTLRPGGIEASNVDLTRELTELIALQRGYQASSQVLGTASEMLEKLFDLKGSKK
ncbi:MAG: hypothetical protein RIR70_1442 [Pseudomonadota bacterium]